MSKKIADSVLNLVEPGTGFTKIIIMCHHSCVLKVLNPSFPGDCSSSENSKALGASGIPEVQKVSKEKATFNQPDAN